MRNNNQRNQSILKCDINTVTAFLFIFAGLSIFGYLSSMLISYPLFDFAINDLIWTREWLYMTILDYYGLAISICCIVIRSEPFPYGIIWSLGFCLLGSPICCFYIVYRLLFKSVILHDHDYYSVKSDINEFEMSSLAFDEISDK